MDQNPSHMSKRRAEILNKSLPPMSEYLNGCQIREILDIGNDDYKQPAKFVNFSNIQQTSDRHPNQSEQIKSKLSKRTT